MVDAVTRALIFTLHIAGHYLLMEAQVCRLVRRLNAGPALHGEGATDSRRSVMRAPASPQPKTPPGGKPTRQARDEEPQTVVNSSTPPSLRALLDLCESYMEPVDIELIRDAYTVAEQAHHGVKRRSGEPFIEHPLAVARILAELAIDAQGIAAALLHDTVEDTTLTLDDVAARFGPVIASIVDGVTKFSFVESSGTGDSGSHAYPQASEVAPPPDAKELRERKARQQEETVRKLFLVMGHEPRVLLLKLADRLHNLRTLASMSPAQRERTSRETLDIYAPLAGRVGLYLLKSEMEDLAFSYTDPQAYTETVKGIHTEEARHAEWAERMCARIGHELQARGILAVVTWRTKRPYRAYVEAQEGGMDVGMLHDLIAFRVITTTEDNCYAILGIIHRLWHPHDDRIRDYIHNPKLNGYRSLHTSVFALDGRLAQIYIRTHQMHRAAQHGVAVYWLERAAHGKRADAATPLRPEDLPEWVRQLSTWHTELNFSASEFVEALRGDIFEEQTYVFTPKGEIQELPSGSTVLDFAYQIHTKIGDHAIGAEVQTTGSQGMLMTRHVPVEYLLAKGDVVRVLTDPDATPKPEWRDIARTRYARGKIARALRLMARGDHEYDHSVRRSDSDEPGEAFQLAPLSHPDGMLADAALARCCCPCPGDALAGVVHSGKRVTVHRACCDTMCHTLEARKAAGAPHAEALPVHWPQIHPQTYRVHLTYVGQDHKGLMHELSLAASQFGLNVSASRAAAIQDRHKAAVSLTLDVPLETRLDAVVRRFMAVPGSVSVTRDTSKGCSKPA